MFCPPPSWGRGGGGCLLEGTPVLTPSGPIPIEELTVGAPVWCVTGGRLQPARVEGLTEVHPEESLEISAAGAKLRVTPEHPLMVGPGQYRLAGHIKVGDIVCLAGDGRTEAVRVEATHKFLSERPAFNLLVIPGGTFVAAGFVVHNKGCFLPDSPILRSDGTEVQISSVQPGDKLLAFTAEGRLVTAKVQHIVRHEVNEYILLKTDREMLRVTREHPFYVGNGTFRTLEALRPGDTIIAWDGQSLAEQRIVSLERVRERVPVFNLQTDQPNTFFAGRIAVHNKGGGCFPRGTRIAMPVGQVPIETLARDDQILTIDDNGHTLQAHVERMFLARGRLLNVETDHETVMATEEHPIGLWKGDFREAGKLQPGDRIRQWKDGRSVMATVLSMSAAPEESLVLNLQVSDPHTFIAERTVVHNKGGGCFPDGTLIRTPQGQTPIEKLSPGDPVIALDPEGRLVHARVESVLTTQSQVLVVHTDRGTLRTTEEHPVARPDGTFSLAGDLRQRERVLVDAKGLLRQVRVHSAFLEGHSQKVFNLTVTEPHTFLAEGFVVHNKGGGFRSSGSSRSGGGDQDGGSLTKEDLWYGMFAVFVCAVLPVTLVLVWFFIANRKRMGKDENLDFRFSRGDVDRKAAKTEKLLGFLSQQDPSVSPGDLRKLAESTFLKLQECWEKRDYEPMKQLLMSALFKQHLAQIQGMVRNHEINRLENLKVERVDLVNVRYTEKPDQREFTGLISATLRDYYVDDRTGKFLRGDDEPARFQEFWTFQRSGDQWLLREIEQSGESDILKDENFVEMLTDETVRQIYGDKAGKEGVAGPWLGKGAEEKATRIDRMLNFLVQTDKLWNRGQMLERARQVFISVYLARESGDLAAVPGVDLFPQVARALQDQVRQNQMNDLTMEYRNLCVRKVDLVLVRNFADRAKDEFTVRISAHTQNLTPKTL